MGTADYIEHADLAVALSPDLSEDLQLHIPDLQAPTLEDRVEVDSTLLSGTKAVSGIGGVDVVDVSDETRRFCED